MEEHQFTNGSSGSALCEDVLDEDETRLIIDEGCLSSEDNHGKLIGEVPKFVKLKSRKDVQETSHAYPCPDCGKMFRRKVKLQAHLLTHKSKEEMECENCGKKFRKVDALFNHVCSGFGNSYKCPDCDEWFRLKKDLTIHQQSHRKSSTSDGALDEKNPSEELDFSSFVASFVKWPITCTHCGVELANLEDYNAHMAAHKEGQPCVCSVCKMRFSCNDDYLLHKDLCHIEGIFECTCCNKRFHTEKKLGEHLESHSGEGVCCDVCNLSFVSKDKLVSHMKVHKMNIFVCGKCKKIFKCNSSFKNHTCSIPDNSEKKFYTFADPLEKKGNEQYLDSMSVNDESDSEDADMCQVLSEAHLCKVCGDSFKQKEDLNLHLTNHFQCIECKKYFKRQTDLDMHVFLLAEEKLYSCCLCETIVHGKKELEYHLSQHLAADDVPLDDSEWDDNTEAVQNVISNLDITEPLQSTLLERSIANVKLHKVIPAGNNALKCSSCGKFVIRHHSLSAHIEPNTPMIDSDEEYVYISRLGSPQNKAKQTEETYCTCHHKFTILPGLGEQSPSKSLSEYECQEVQKLINNSLHQPKSILEESIDSKSKSLLSEDTEDSSVGQMDVSNDNGSNSDRPNDFEVLNPETKTNKTLLISNQLLNRDSTDSPASSISDHLSKKDSKNRSDYSKLTLHNTELVDKREVSSPKKSGIKIFKLNSKVPPSFPKKTNIKDVVLSMNKVSGNVVVAKPVKILISTGISGAPTFNVEPQPELLNGGDGKKSASPLKNSTTKRSLAEVNLVNQEELILHSLTGDDVGKSFPETPVSISKKIKQEKSTKKVPPSEPKADKTELISIHPKGKIPLRVSNNEILTTESKPQNGKNEKRKNVNQQALNPHSTIEVKVVKHARKPKTLSKTDPMLRANNKKARPPRRRTTFRKREQGIHKIRPDASTPNGNGSEPSYIPEANMIFKVEQLGYESDEDEEEEESLDFSGIKKEFLASDVFIKEEEWDIVDF